VAVSGHDSHFPSYIGNDQRGTRCHDLCRIA